MELTERQKKQRGLGFLLLANTKYESDKHQYLNCLEEHPFGLSIPQGIKIWGTTQINFVGEPGLIDSSINNMAKFLGEILSNPLDDAAIYLRVIFAEAFPDDPDRHFVYYEVGITSAVYICNGCTDFSGGGKLGKEQMDWLFSLLSDLYQVEIEKVTIPFAQAEEAIHNLRAIIRT